MGEVKLSLSKDDMILYVKSFKDPNQNKQTKNLQLLRVINELRKLAGYNIVKTQLHFHSLAMNNQKRKLRKKSIYNSTKKNKIGDQFNKDFCITTDHMAYKA